MEVDWAQRQLASYAFDGQQIFQRLVKGEANQVVVERALDLLRTYLSIPAYVQSLQLVDETMVRLAWALHIDVHPRGYWDEICLLWPHIQLVAKRLPDPAHYAEVTRHLAITKNDRGEGEAAQQLYEDLLASPHFEQITLDQQADILHQLGVCYIDQGKYVCAQQVLTRCLTLAEPPSDASNIRDSAADLQCRISHARCAAALVWESKAYAHNQLGNMALSHGDFATARRHYTESLRLFTGHGEAHNLACVAYQALGRLLVIQAKYAEATSLLEKNLIIRRRRSEKKGSAYAAAYLADAYLRAGRLTAAEPLLNEALAACGDLHDRRGITLCHLYFGYLEQARGHRQAALDQWQQAKELAVAVPVLSVELQVLTALWVGLLRAGRLHEWWFTMIHLYRNIRQQELGTLAAWRLLKQYLR